MWTLTGFADEISHDFTEQLTTLQRLGVGYLEFRSAWGTKILDLTPEQLDDAKRLLAEHGVQVSSIGSDLGKILITDDFEPHLQRTRHAVEVARFFDAPFIRIFSFFIPEGDDPDAYRDEVMARTKAMVEVAESAGVTLLHENEKEIYGDVPRRVVDLITTIDSPRYRGIFDPANYVQCGVKPFDEAYPLVREFTDYIHCKDASATEFASEDQFAGHINKVLPCGEGDGQVREVIAALRESGYDGFFSLEPHLGDFDAFGGLCGPDLWGQAHAALVKLFDERGIEYR